MTKTACQTPFKFVPEFKAAVPFKMVPFGNCIATITVLTPLELSVIFALNVKLAGPDVTLTLDGEKLKEVMTGACVS